jgi:hypothetical protein
LESNGHLLQNFEKESLESWFSKVDNLDVSKSVKTNLKTSVELVFISADLFIYFFFFFGSCFKVSYDIFSFLDKTKFGIDEIKI